MVAYPYGSYNLNTITAARKAGYSVQLLVGDNTSGIDYEVNMTDDGLEDLKRITVAGTMGQRRCTGADPQKQWPRSRPSKSNGSRICGCHQAVKKYINTKNY